MYICIPIWFRKDHVFLSGHCTFPRPWRKFSWDVESTSSTKQVLQLIECEIISHIKWQLYTSIEMSCNIGRFSEKPVVEHDLFVYPFVCASLTLAELLSLWDSHPFARKPHSSYTCRQYFNGIGRNRSRNSSVALSGSWSAWKLLKYPKYELVNAFRMSHVDGMISPERAGGLIDDKFDRWRLRLVRSDSLGDV